MSFRRSLAFLVMLCTLATAWAQPTVQPVQIVITPNHDNWEYKAGEPATFSVQVLKFGVPQKGVKIFYQVGPERMKPLKSDSVVLKDAPFQTAGFTMKEPGFLRCVVTATVDGKVYRNLTTAGYDITKIQPAVEKPADFEKFWSANIAELSKLPLDAKFTLLPERSSSKTNAYHVSCQGYGGSRIYGMLAVPKAPGKYPAVLQVPGAGIRPYAPDLELADKGVIVFTIGIHGIPVNMDPQVYSDLVNGGLKSYFYFNLDDRDKNYYKRVYTNVVRANDLLVSLPEYDGKTLAVMGGSQGGALSVVTASLDKRVKYMAALYPALADLTGYLKGRAGGWPHMFSEGHPWNPQSEKAQTALAYYDVVNFARQVKIEGYYSWGFNDETCPPTSFYAAYNVVNAPKQANIFHDTGHWTYPEQRQAISQWLLSKIRP
jgi:cephalosporin-C deacetylase-like acetyl esterase